ncbi:hypothetical protein R6Q59_005975 [Mikania micrantha]
MALLTIAYLRSVECSAVVRDDWAAPVVGGDREPKVGNSMGWGTIFRVLKVEFFICLVLTIPGYLPGIIYALYAILCVNPDRDVDRYEALA